MFFLGGGGGGVAARLREWVCAWDVVGVVDQRQRARRWGWAQDNGLGYMATERHGEALPLQLDTVHACLQPCVHAVRRTAVLIALGIVCPSRRLACGGRPGCGLAWLAACLGCVQPRVPELATPPWQHAPWHHAPRWHPLAEAPSFHEGVPLAVMLPTPACLPPAHTHTPPRPRPRCHPSPQTTTTSEQWWRERPMWCS